ncbi:MAG: glycosyltransferase family 1 protein, partial [Terrimesophilobacter sp.]
MTTLNVIVDAMTSERSHCIGRYTEELTRELIRVAPAGCDVVGITSAVSAEHIANLEMLLPDIAQIQPSKLSRSALEASWRL